MSFTKFAAKKKLSTGKVFQTPVVPRNEKEHETLQGKSTKGLATGGMAGLLAGGALGAYAGHKDKSLGKGLGAIAGGAYGGMTGATVGLAVGNHKGKRKVLEGRQRKGQKLITKKELTNAYNYPAY